MDLQVADTDLSAEEGHLRFIQRYRLTDAACRFERKRQHGYQLAELCIRPVF